MALTLFTNSASMSSNNAMNKSIASMTTAMQRLGTGKRINSAADDAAGLQIATRLQAQTNGMGVAHDNIEKATSMLQTAEGAFDEVNNILYRMKDLATQAADDTNSADDRTAINQEFGELNAELANIMGNTSYGTEKLLISLSASASGGGSTGASGKSVGKAAGVSGKLAGKLQFQIGASTDETLKVDFSENMKAVGEKLGSLQTIKMDSAEAGNAAIDTLNGAIKEVGSMRSSLGANINRLGHTKANLANMKDNTNVSLGIIRDANYATEATSMMRQQMLSQSSQSMLKQANGMSQMVLGMLG
ncbi:flagellin N-terminal helical domain-containing protein [Erwinia sorbitola]|uniref:Flagellin n=1 Tax=Erwinia sorbitola TaxID=2681984 RepID=A0A6I6F3S5_9GAMM|nr:flagellin [Erwinia sorbitola]MTD26947.1 lateral flagellin LafA [Erwinia sorbitola]QGU88510.1 lateral flagellin LafA [Erwinia sorbitola]